MESINNVQESDIFREPYNTFKELVNIENVKTCLEIILSKYSIETGGIGISIKHTLDNKHYGPMYEQVELDEETHKEIWEVLTNTICIFHKRIDYRIMIMVSYCSLDIEDDDNVIMYIM